MPGHANAEPEVYALHIQPAQATPGGTIAACAAAAPSAACFPNQSAATERVQCVAVPEGSPSAPAPAAGLAPSQPQAAGCGLLTSYVRNAAHNSKESLHSLNMESLASASQVQVHSQGHGPPSPSAPKRAKADAPGGHAAQAGPAAPDAGVRQGQGQGQAPAAVPPAMLVPVTCPLPATFSSLRRRFGAAVAGDAEALTPLFAGLGLGAAPADMPLALALEFVKAAQDAVAGGQGGCTVAPPVKHPFS